jgi:hypothetical protein
MNETYTPPAALGGAESLLSLINLLGDRVATKKMLDQLVAASQALIVAHDRLGDAKAKHDAIAKERAAFETWMAAERAKLRDEFALLSADKDRLAADRHGHLATVAAHNDRAAALEADKQAHARDLEALHKFRNHLAA